MSDIDEIKLCILWLLKTRLAEKATGTKMGIFKELICLIWRRYTVEVMECKCVYKTFNFIFSRFATMQKLFSLWSKERFQFFFSYLELSLAIWIFKNFTRVLNKCDCNLEIILNLYLCMILANCIFVYRY